MFKELLECLLCANKIQDLLNIQSREVEIENPKDYMVGLYNGLSVAKSVCDNTEPDLRSVKENNEKEEWFETRTNNHIKLVQEAAKKIADKLILSASDSEDLLTNVKSHDESKLNNPIERIPYIEISWKHKQDNFKGYKTPGTLPDKAENEATLHHITTNKHHPEFWNKDKANLDPNNRDKSVKCIDASKMPDLYIAEMLADWYSMSEELKKNTAREWYNSQKDVRWHFSPHQEELIDKLLKVFE